MHLSLDALDAQTGFYDFMWILFLIWEAYDLPAVWTQAVMNTLPTIGETIFGVWKLFLKSRIIKIVEGYLWNMHGVVQQKVVPTEKNFSLYFTIINTYKHF